MLIKNVNIISKNNEFFGDIRIDNHKIIKIANNIIQKNDEKVIDANGQYLLPKLIDLNVRLRDNTLNNANIDEILRNAKTGGVGKIVLIDDFSPKIENATHLEMLEAKILSKKSNIEIILSVNSINKEEKLNNIATFIKDGAKVIYTKSDINGNFLIRVMQYAVMKNIPVFCFCENIDMKNRGVMNEGEVSYKLGLPGISKIAEISEVAKIVELATFFNVKVVFQSVSTSKSIHILKAVKKDNKKVFTEVSIHNLILNDTMCDDFNTKAKLISPLREEKERVKMIEQLKNGFIDVITSSHSPKSYIYKDVAFEEAQDGIDSLSLTLKLGYTYLVKNNIISMHDLMKMISYNPASILNENNDIQEGYSDDFILFDGNKKSIVKDESSLYFNKELYGEIKEI